MVNKPRQYVARIVSLAAAWVVLQQSITPLDVLAGLLVGTAVTYLSRHFWTSSVRIRNVRVLLRLIVEFSRQIATANLQVAVIVLRPRLQLRPAFVVLPLELRDDFTITVLANMITLTPGTLTVDIAPDRSALYVHCLTTEDAEAVRHDIKLCFEKPLLEAVSCSPS